MVVGGKTVVCVSRVQYLTGAGWLGGTLTQVGWSDTETLTISYLGVCEQPSLPPSGPNVHLTFLRDTWRPGKWWWGGKMFWKYYSCLSVRLCQGGWPYIGCWHGGARQRPDVNGVARSSAVARDTGVTSGTPGHRFQWGPFWHDASWQWVGTHPCQIWDTVWHFCCHVTNAPLWGRPLDYGCPPLATSNVTSLRRCVSNHHSCQRSTFMMCHRVHRQKRNNEQLKIEKKK